MSVPMSAESITVAERSLSSSEAIRASSIACSFLASSYSAFSEMSPNSRASLIRPATSRRRLVVSSSSSALRLASPSGVRRTSLGIACSSDRFWFWTRKNPLRMRESPQSGLRGRTSIDAARQASRKSSRVVLRLTGPVAQELVRLLERRPVDPWDQRLRDRPDRAELDRIGAHLVAGGADLVGRIDLLRRLSDRLAQRRLERRSAALQRAAPAVDPVQRTEDALAERSAQVLLDDSVEADVPAGPQMGTGGPVARLVVDRKGVLHLAQQLRTEHRLELRLDQQRPPRVHDPDRVGLLVVA